MSERRDGLRLVTGGVDSLGADGSSAGGAGVDSSGVVASGQSEHALLAAGKITVDEYMDMTVDRALSHIRGRISAERFAEMRRILRAELEQDPGLSELVARVAVGD